MAKPNRIFAISLGSQTVRLAEFAIDARGGLTLQNYKASELMADPALDASRVGQTGILLTEMAAGLRAGSCDTNYAISAQSVFTRFVKLPPVGEDQIDQIVTFEAQQNVPYPIDEVNWDYQRVTSSQADKIEVVIVAIKDDLLEEHNSAVEDAGFRTGIVDVGPMALYNAFRYNYSDLDGTSLVIDIGARSTNLIFAEGDKVFTRTVPIGGNTLTAAIAKDFNEPFADAEERKKRQGFVSLGGTYAEPQDPEVARVSKVIRTTMTKLHADITRLISFYRSQQNGKAPERVFLAGGAVGMPYMREFFAEKLALPIEFINPLRHVPVSKSADVNLVGRDSHLLGELVGLGLRSGNDCPMELNLRPVSVARHRTLEGRVPCFLLALLCLLLSFAVGWAWFSQATARQTAFSEQLAGEIGKLQGVESQFKRIQKEIAAGQATIAPVVQAVEDREYWVRLINDLNARLPERHIWVTSIEVKAPDEREAAPTPTPVPGRKAGAQPDAAPRYKLIVQGLYMENPRAEGLISDFVQNLGKSPYYTVLPDWKRSPISGADWAFGYSIPLSLNRPTLP